MKPLLQRFIEKIESLQSKGDQLFPPGIFPAKRTNPLIGYQRPDTTIFFSAISCFTLKSIRKNADRQTQELIDSICNKIIANYPDFRNKDGLATYNFWKTKPSRHFPNGHIFHRYEHFRIPDDIDDTAFIYLTTERSKEELVWLKEKLAMHSNGAKQWIRNTYPEYRRLKAYSTWFGKNMYVEFDVCVLSNMLYCLFDSQLPLNEHDEASLEYIRSVIATDRYRQVPFRCAHQYPRTPLIIYHVARLIAAFSPPALESVKAKLIRDTQHLLSTTTSDMDKVILSTALLRLGEKPARVPVENFTAKNFDGFVFFIAGLLTAYENPLLYKLSVLPLFHMYWLCEAHCWTLLAEYETVWAISENVNAVTETKQY
ncbi:hypothetical protein DYBT9623_02368 [Dyadobacter sp. CECT 9623]|uniref:Uncharacterized protein n=1 Tax=Dyadobacter linearis TaxID=2823330 RepID=A0ABM8UQ89_9BACT|nr:hypothetical protein [Dyadobacter sp. CECT 9623]CAG5069632.1 hypothetical protein DYBT9623_02368 [Dyadobacter sp. CECT 9623]